MRTKNLRWLCAAEKFKETLTQMSKTTSSSKSSRIGNFVFTFSTSLKSFSSLFSTFSRGSGKLASLLSTTLAVQRHLGSYPNTVEPQCTASGTPISSHLLQERPIRHSTHAAQPHRSTCQFRSSPNRSPTLILFY